MCTPSGASMALRRVDKYLLLSPTFNATTVKGKFNLIISCNAKTEAIPWKEFERALKDITIRGEKGIHAFDNDGELQLTGTNLQQEFERFNESSLILKTNNVIEAWKTLGIEAAYSVLVQELNKVFNYSVDILLFKILAEYMCFLGKVSPTSRMGIHNFYDDNTFKGMSFERTLKTASAAADKKLKTRFDGLSERIITNRLIRHGTGMSEIIEDTTKQDEYQNTLKRKRYESDDDEDPWLMDVEEEDNPFVGGEDLIGQSYSMPAFHLKPISENVLKPIVIEKGV